MRIIITGVAGFIGFHLAKSCCELGYDVFGVDNFLCGYQEHITLLSQFSTFTFYKGSAHDDIVASWLTSDTYVVHLAGLSALASNQENPFLSYTNNVAVTAGLLEKCRLHGVRHFIFASTSAVYENSKDFPTPEDTSVNPDLLYSLGKKHAEDVITSFGTIYGLPFTLLRFFNVYGSHQDSIRTNPPLLPYLVSCFKKNSQPVLHSDGLQRRDYIHVSDVVSLIHKIMTLPATNDVYNVCTGETVSVRELVDLLQSEMCTSIQPIYRDPVLLWDKSPVLWNGVHTFPKERMMEEVNKYSCGDPSKTYLNFGWKATCTIRDGIRKLLE